MAAPFGALRLLRTSCGKLVFQRFYRAHAFPAFPDFLSVLTELSGKNIAFIATVLYQRLSLPLFENRCLTQERISRKNQT